MAGFRFRGFSRPNYTQVPDELFDELLPELREAEIKALLYIIRRTFGFKRDADSISFNQFLGGITTKDGRVLDRGCGIKNRTNLSKALKSLEEKGIIEATKGIDAQGENQTTVFRLRFFEGVPNRYYPGTEAAPLLVPERYPQETEQQETVGQEAFEISKGPTSDFGFGPERDAVRAYLADFARELGDTAPLAASVTRAAKLYRRSGLGLDAFVEALYAARAKTKERTAAIRSQPLADGRAIPLKPKMAYFFAVLEDLVRQRQAESAD